MKRKKIKNLIVGAYPQELTPFVDLGKSYQKIDGDVAYLSAGIGPVPATFGLTHFLEDYDPEHIFAVGTAGCIEKSSLEIGDVVSVASVGCWGRSLPNYNFATFIPHLQISKLNLKATQHFSLVELPQVSVFAPQDISQSQNWSEILKAQSYDAEHLESFAYAFVAHKFKVPLTIILGMTNHIGPEATQQWKQNESALMNKIFKLINPILTGHLSER